jgi:hypothetical protein
MANTYTLIQAQNLVSTAVTVTFSSIPATYTDLVIKASTRSDRASSIQDNVLIYLNGVTTNMSFTYLEGNGAAASSGRNSSSQNQVGISTATTATSNTFSNWELYIPNYAGSTNKPMGSSSVMETNATTSYIDSFAGLWSNTAAITSISFQSTLSTNFISGSSFYLYGIKNS